MLRFRRMLRRRYGSLLRDGRGKGLYIGCCCDSPDLSARPPFRSAPTESSFSPDQSHHLADRIGLSARNLSPSTTSISSRSVIWDNLAHVVETLWFRRWVVLEEITRDGGEVCVVCHVGWLGPSYQDPEENDNGCEEAEWTMRVVSDALPGEVYRC